MVASASDAAAVHAVERHHAELAGAHVEALLNAVGCVADSGVDAVEPARGRLVGFCTAELLPHAAAEEGSLYLAAAASERARHREINVQPTIVPKETSRRR